MGNQVVKCCGVTEEKYKKKQKRVDQPEQEESSVRVATNQGSTVDRPSNGIGGKELVKNTKDEKSKASKTAPPRKKCKKANNSSADDDSTDSSDSSTESTSSDSVRGKGKVTSSRKVYKNKSGGTTIVSKKTIIGGNQTNIGNNAGNIVINIETSSRPRAKREKKAPGMAGLNTLEVSQKQGPFQSYYTKERAKEEVKRQYASFWQNDSIRPPGNFINVMGQTSRIRVFNASLKVDVAKYVCRICYPGGSGTGFRVGPRHIMTALHVVEMMINSGHRSIGSSEDTNPFAVLQQPDVYARFNFLRKTDLLNPRDRFNFKPYVPYYNKKLDTAVLELEEQADGTMPESFLSFSIPQPNDSFTLIGYTGYEPIEWDDVKQILDVESQQTKRDIMFVKKASYDHAGKDYECAAAFNTLENPDRFAFHCTFSKGASGSPGVIIKEDGRVAVVTMLLCGYPDWYYDLNLPQDLKNRWPKEYCIEQGVKMEAVYNSMLRDNPELCRSIFDSEHSIPNPNLPAVDLEHNRRTMRSN